MKGESNSREENSIEEPSFCKACVGQCDWHREGQARSLQKEASGQEV